MGKITTLLNKIRGKSFVGSVGVGGKIHTVDWNSREQLKAYERSVYVYSAIKKRAEKVGQIQFTLSKNDKEIIDNPYLDLLNKPNQTQTKNEFFELYQTYKDLTGSAYIYLLRTTPGAVPEEMHNLRPDWVTVCINENTGEVLAYKYKNEKTHKELIFDVEDVICSMYPSPLRSHYLGIGGQSPLKPGALTVDTELQLATYHYSVLKNGGKIEGILNYKSTNLTRNQLNEIKEEFKKHYAGSEKSGQPFVTYGGAEYQNLGLTPTELSFMESKKMTRNDILMIYGVPKVIVAQTDDVNFANAKEGKAVFLSETIKPLLDNLVAKLNQFLVPDDLTLDYIDPTPADVELMIKKIDSGSNNHYMTINEMRELANLEPLPEGNVILVPFNLIPLGETKPIKPKE